MFEACQFFQCRPVEHLVLVYFLFFFSTFTVVFVVLFVGGLGSGACVLGPVVVYDGVVVVQVVVGRKLLVVRRCVGAARAGRCLDGRVWYIHVVLRAGQLHHFSVVRDDSVWAVSPVEAVQVALHAGSSSATVGRAGASGS